MLIVILALSILVALVAATTRCLTYEEKILGRLQTVCMATMTAPNSFGR